MARLLIVLFVFSMCNVFGQTSKEHLENGITKHEAHDFKGAIKDYSSAIKEDKKNRDAYFNRGTCQLALKEYKSALSDFDKTIKLDPDFAKAYYSRATVYVSQQKYVEALPDLDKAIEIDPTIPNALTLRGQIRAQTNNEEGACSDFIKAKEIGDPQAEKYLSRYCGNEQQEGESLMINWPEEGNWKLGNSQENEQMTMLEIIHSDESLEKWTEMGNMMSIKGAKNIPMDKAMNLMFEQAKEHAPEAKLTFIEKDESVDYPWIIFSIEAPSFTNDTTPESQLWYVVQGKTALYTNFIAVKEATLNEEFISKWTKVFKDARIVNK